MLSLLFKRSTALTLLIIILFATSSYTKSETFDEPTRQDRYQIEFIIFKHLNADETVLAYEDHAPLVLKSNKQKQTFIIEGFEPLVSAQNSLLEVDTMLLKESYEKLSRSIATRVLNRSAWIQTVENDETLPPVFISKKLQRNEQSTSDISSTLEGQAVIKRSRYMHAKFDLAINQYVTLPYSNILDWFFDPTPFPFNWLTQALQLKDTYLDNKGEARVLLSSIKLQQSRRIKDGEVHYIDHPLLGIIVTIKKLDPIPEYETF